MNWKTLAIVLGISLFLETAFVIYTYSVGSYILEQDRICSVICRDQEPYVAYYYDDYMDECYCYDEAGDYFLMKKYELK